MAENNHSRRRFLEYAVAGIAAAAVAGSSYYYIAQKPTGISTTVSPTSAIPSPTATTPNSTLPSPSPSPTPTTPTPAPSPMSEDEKMVRQLLEKDWVEAYNSNNLNRILSLYTEDATLLSGDRNQQRQHSGLRGDHSISWYYQFLFSGKSKVFYYRIATLSVSDKDARILCYYYYTYGGDVGPCSSKYQLKKITEVTKGNTTTKLPNPIWRIYDELTQYLY